MKQFDAEISVQKGQIKDNISHFTCIIIYRFDISQLTIDKNTTEFSMSASYLDISLNRVINGKLTTQLYDKRDDFYLHRQLSLFM